VTDPAPVTTDPSPDTVATGVVNETSLSAEVAGFRNVEDEVKRGDLEIRRLFARNVMILFAMTNVFVMAGLGWLAVGESHAIAGKTLAAADRIIDSEVVMALLAATTVQLGTVIYTIARAIFPSSSGNGSA
jgi:hypothetical protein